MTTAVRLRAVAAVLLCVLLLVACDSRATTAVDSGADAADPRCIPPTDDHGLSIGRANFLFNWDGIPSPIELGVAQVSGCSLSFEHPNSPKIDCSGADLPVAEGEMLTIYHCLDDVRDSRFFSVWKGSGRLVLAGGTGAGVPSSSCLKGIGVTPKMMGCEWETTECGPQESIGLEVSFGGHRVDVSPGQVSVLEVEGERLRAFSRHAFKTHEPWGCTDRADFWISFGLLP